MYIFNTMSPLNFILYGILIHGGSVLAGKLDKPPNIVFVFADDYGFNDVGYHGSEIATPNLDRLAATGVKLENYYVQPICTPSRSQFMSGRYQIHTGLQHEIIWMTQANGLPLNIPTVADMLKKQGYSTHIVGKWHLGFYKEEYTPIYRGFDSFYGYLGGSEEYYQHTRSDTIKVNGTTYNMNGLDFRHNMDPVWNKNGSYSANIFAERAQKLVTKHAKYNKDQPMFLYLPFQSVHSPLQVPKMYEERYSFINNKNRRVYAGMVSCLDEAIGNITQTLKDRGMWENTVFIFSTDNGGQVMEGGNNWPLRGWKTQLWEGGVRGVGFVASPLLEKPGTINRQLVHVSDWFPTIVGLAGGSTAGLNLDGFDQWESISNNLPGPRHELLHNIDPLWLTKGQRWTNSSFDNSVRAAVRMGDWKLITGDPGTGAWVPPPHLSGFTESFQVEEDPKKNLWLFNIKNDPEERVDLSVTYPGIVQKLLGRLIAYNATAVPARYPPDDPACDPKLHGGVWGPWRD